MITLQPNTFVNNVRQWRDFLDILKFCRQNRAQLIIAPNHPQLVYLVELQNNFDASIKTINDAYTSSYSRIRAYKGELYDASSKLIMKEMVIANSRNMNLDADKKWLFYSRNNQRNEIIELECEFLALIDTDGYDYLGTKIYMRKNMIELISL